MKNDNGLETRLRQVQDFSSLVQFLRDDLQWPLTSDDVEELTFEYSPEELGFDKKLAVKIRSIKQIRPMESNQPWGIFFIDFEPKRLPVGALRRLLRSLVVKKRGGAVGQSAWNREDLLFISFQGDIEQRSVAFAHFHDRVHKSPQLRTFYWDRAETRFEPIVESLEALHWPEYTEKPEMSHVWRKAWSQAFRAGHGEVIKDSKALSKALAKVATKIKEHVFDLLDSEDPGKGPIHRLLESFRKALLHDLTEHRFADVLAQTFTYGLLAAKAEIGTNTPLEPGHLAQQIPTTNPLLRELFEEFQHLTGLGLDKLDEDLGDLGVDELVDLLNTVDVDEALKNFGRTTMSGQEDPVVHFYEEFLNDYDKEQKVERGVFYTPSPVVSFIVRSVHESFQKEFGLEDGLASTVTWDEMATKHHGLAKPEGIRGDEPFVQILDPAVGTGTFLEGCIQLIYDTMAAKWRQAGKDVEVEWNRYVPEHLLPRLHGFELMMAPYVVCHMKLGLRLKQLGYDFRSGERLRVYLANALEKGQEDQTAFATMVASVAHEAYAANIDKLRKHFSAIIGNPPYSGISANMSPFAQSLVEPYKFIDGIPMKERKIWIQDDYVKFIRLGQMHIERSEIGILAFVTNHGYLENPTFRGMRRSLQLTFNAITAVNLHGNSNRKERVPHGGDDKNIFDIKQGVSVFLANRCGSLFASDGNTVHYADVWGTRQTKYELLSGSTCRSIESTSFTPDPPFYFFKPHESELKSEYNRGNSLPDIMPVHSAGFITARDHFVVSFSRSELAGRLEAFCDLSIPDEEIRQTYFGGKGSSKYPNGDTRGWKLGKVRRQLAMNTSAPVHIITCQYRPFDKRFILWDEAMIDWPRPEVSGHLLAPGNVAILTARSNKTQECDHFYCSDCPAEAKAAEYSTQSAVFPLLLSCRVGQLSLDSTTAGGLTMVGNFSEKFLTDLRISIGASVAEGIQLEISECLQVGAYIYATFNSPGYRLRYAEFLKSDFPRVFLPGSRTLYDELAKLGSQLFGLHLLRPANVRDAPRTCSAQSIDNVGRVYYEGNAIWVTDRQTVRFVEVQKDVWEFSVGGYQPCQKWLKDRKGRSLTEAEIRHYEELLYAIGETIRIMAEIDEVIEAHGGWPDAFLPEATNVS